MLPVAAPQRSRCARHLPYGLVQLLQRFYRCKYEIADVNFFFVTCMLCLADQTIECH
jgi:hypothetical protein